MNRRDRRRAARKNRHQYLIADPATIASLDVSCPDCTSETERWTDALGLPHMTIRHDDTCPTWRSMQ